MEANDSFSDSEDYFLQPISKLCPPNEIISKSYTPDEKPVLKLIKLEKSETINSGQLRNKFKTVFECEDTLGYEYCCAPNNQIVYHKFNNQNYFKLKTKNRTYKYLAGLFLPVDKIINNQVKGSKNVYRTLQDIDFVEYKSNIKDCFGKNCKSFNPTTPKFSSNFQSGNLFIARRKKQFQYDLILQNDINSKGNTQWFNFAVQFNQQGSYKFNILNFTKSYSQYQDGMRIVYFSSKDQQLGKSGWSRGCTNIKYEQSSVKRQDNDHKYYSSLQFEYLCDYPTDRVVFSYFYPYTSLDLEKFLKKILYRKINVHMKMEKTKIAETASGLPVLVLSIHHKRNQKVQNFTSSTPNIKLVSNLTAKQNKCVIILSRQHPGETQGSFLTEGIVEALMENGQLTHQKRNVDFYIFPLINGDGVLYGNYRTNLTGTDLNRIWRSARKDLHPQIYYIKRYLNIVNKQSPISLILDLHGHSKSLNSFFYGNPPRKDNFLNGFDDSRIFPYLCSKKIKQISFAQSTFSITEDKKNSARVVLSQMFPKAHVYTFQNSFQGWRKDQNTIHQYTPDSLRKIGRQIVLTYFQYEKLTQKNPQIKQKWIKQINDLKSKIDQKLYSAQYDQGGSDSEAEEQLIQIEAPLDKNSIIQPEKSIFDDNRDLESVIKKQVKDKLTSHNMFMQRLIYNRYKHKLANSEEFPVAFERQIISPKEIKAKQLTASQGFLSIVKIKTKNNCQLLNQKNSEFQSLEKHMELEAKESIIEKLKKKKIRIEEAVHSNFGMKTFLRTMGIPLEKKIL